MIVCFPRTSLDSPFHRFLNKRIDNRVANHYQIQNTDLVHPDQPAEPILFSGLPPLHPGQPVLHVHNGIQNARQLASAGEPDAEKAFFVADLGDVFRQHRRWISCLPEIQPFYGSCPLSLPKLIDSPQLSSATQTHTSSGSSPLSEPASTALPTAKSTKSSPSAKAPSTPPASSSPTRAKPSPSSAPPLDRASTP